MHNTLNQSATAKQLKKVQSKIAYYTRQYARMRNIERKQETRRKIQLGGLIKKVGIDNESTAVLLGLLLEASERLASNDGDLVRKQWQIKGNLALTLEQKT